MRNPDVKKGDLILLKNATQGAAAHNGKILEVLSVHNITSSDRYALCRVKGTATGNFNIYYNYDEYCMADRQEQAKWLKEKVDGMKKEIKSMEAEIDHLLNYESEEEYVATKLKKLFDNKTDVAAMTDILKELKASHIL